MRTGEGIKSLLKDGVVLVHSLETATGLFSRMRGLLGRRTLADGCGMCISPCNSIHTFFMKFPLDLVFLSAEDEVVKTFFGVRPWTMVYAGGRARKVIEVRAGWLSRDALKIGDRITLSDPRS